MNHRPFLLSLAALLVAPLAGLDSAEPAQLEFTVKLETVMKHDDGKFITRSVNARSPVNRGHDYAERVVPRRPHPVIPTAGADT